MIKKNNCISVVCKLAVLVFALCSCSSSSSSKDGDEGGEEEYEYSISAPANVRAELDNIDFIVKVSWDAVPHADSYLVCRSDNASSAFVQMADGVVSTSWTDSSPLVGNNYYVVYAVRDGQRSEASAVVSVTYTPLSPITPPSPISGTPYTVNGVTFKMVKVLGGTFKMGANDEQDSDVESDEKPVHDVTLSDYYIGATEVTQELWVAVMGSNPSYNKGDNLPVDNVSWDDCQEFIKKLNSLTDMTFRLPTEAEWEYAARGGSESKGYKYSGSNTIGDVAWYIDNSEGKPHAVATKSPNELGIYDMSGNVWEWCQDWYDHYYYSSSPQTNPTGPSSGSYRVRRGGTWYYNEMYSRVSKRSNFGPSGRGIDYGLRLAL